jgi:hypothetical protein
MKCLNTRYALNPVCSRESRVRYSRVRSFPGSVIPRFRSFPVPKCWTKLLIHFGPHYASIRAGSDWTREQPNPGSSDSVHTYSILSPIGLHRAVLSSYSSDHSHLCLWFVFTFVLNLEYAFGAVLLSPSIWFVVPSYVRFHPHAWILCFYFIPHSRLDP